MRKIILHIVHCWEMRICFAILRNVIFQYGECILWIDINLQFAQAYFWRNTKSSLYFSLLVGIWFLIYFQLFIYSLKSKSFVCGWCGGTNGRWTPAFLPAPLARDSVSHQNNISNFNKYILQFQQIHLQFPQIHLQFPQIHFAISTNTILDLDNLPQNIKVKEHPHYKYFSHKIEKASLEID